MSGFNTQPPEGGWRRILQLCHNLQVSTHSRPKAAGIGYRQAETADGGFNTQPPEGGWLKGGYCVS
ncbi:hypothetical protein NEIMUCOT_04702 [Neisseria mucosa ATCC 25996]|uniref:Uncharacterized protein n=1 Tax=Neisseria mucosa (strain ATCC 25996 / DSM 4631 / NCTC 10774 / M26) TaxID=546266 RepID=D2ZVQ9_NEIM2|nr:hypothetical protein NEIMUCOT_04702 [Neisseria mucosa ATCC 25996]